MKVNKYMVSWQDNDGADYCKLFKVEQNINRANNTDDYELITDYLRFHHGIDSADVIVDDIDGTINIKTDYQLHE